MLEAKNAFSASSAFLRSSSAIAELLVDVALVDDVDATAAVVEPVEAATGVVDLTATGVDTDAAVDLLYTFEVVEVVVEEEAAEAAAGVATTVLVCLETPTAV